MCCCDNDNNVMLWFIIVFLLLFCGGCGCGGNRSGFNSNPSGSCC
jgi:hypothetical protein